MCVPSKNPEHVDVMRIPAATVDSLMVASLAQATAARDRGEIPVGAVIAHGESWTIIAAEGNRTEELHDASAHAELLALRSAAAHLGSWRLADCVLAVTLEPCPMCASALRLFRLPVVIFGANDPKMGACGSVYDLSSDDRWGAKPLPRVIKGCREAECEKLLRSFFDGIREREQ